MDYTQKRNNPLSFYLRVLLYMFIALLIRVIALAPLAALFIFEKGDPLRWIAVLCPMLLVFLVMPLRYSFAEALVQKKGSRFFSFDTALGTSSYGAKLCEGVLHFLSVLKYAIPLAAIGVYVYKVANEMLLGDIVTAVIEIGRKGTDIYYSVINFFVKLFGGEAIQYASGGMVEGIYVLLGILAIGLLILLIGVMRNSATRYIWAVAERENRPVRTEVRRRIRGRRFTQLLVALLNLALLVPYGMLVYFAVKDVLPDSASLSMIAMTGQMPEVNFGAQNILMLVGAFFGAYMTLLPARRILTAFFAARELRHKAKLAAEEEAQLNMPAGEDYAMDMQAEEPVYMPQEAAVPMQQFAPVQPMVVPIEGMTPVQKMVNGQMQIVYVPNDMPEAIVPDWVQAENNGTAMPETPVIPASFLGGDQDGTNLNA